MTSPRKIRDMQRVAELSGERPDAAPPKKKHGVKEYKLTKKGEFIPAAPPSDAAQPEARERIEADQETLYGYPGEVIPDAAAPSSDAAQPVTHTHGFVPDRLIRVERCNRCSVVRVLNNDGTWMLAHPEDAPEGPTVEHRCGVRGFAESGDDCPACERDREVRDKGDKADG